MFTLKRKIGLLLFDDMFQSKRVVLDEGKDLITESAMNYYGNVTQEQVEAFYKERADPENVTPISYGLNSKLVMKNDQITEQVYKVGGLYSKAIEKVVYWLEKAITVAENEQQQEIPAIACRIL